MAKIIQYRNNCIGCGVCAEQQPELWRMSNKDGKATLLNGVGKKDLFILKIGNALQQQSAEIANACPVKIIKIV
jgi:ferredoxin